MQQVVQTFISGFGLPLGAYLLLQMLAVVRVSLYSLSTLMIRVYSFLLGWIYLLDDNFVLKKIKKWGRNVLMLKIIF